LKPGDQATKICSAAEIDCYENAENELFNGDMTLEDDRKKYRALSACQCLPQCESLKYEIELVKTNLSRVKFLFPAPKTISNSTKAVHNRK
jgi:hypothetical protein